MELIIKLNKNNAVVNADETVDWTPALVAAAYEIQALNAYSGTEEFPRPIKSNPDAANVENFLGDFNTPPTPDRGMVTVSISDYEWIELNLLPAQPTTFAITVGDAPAGKIL